MREPPYDERVMKRQLESMLAEPPAADPPTRVWRDWVVLAVVLTTATLEGLLRNDVLWRPYATAFVIALGFVLLFRRTHPLAAVGVAFGAAIATEIASFLTIGESIGLYSAGFILLLPYSLLRWGSGSDIAVGAALMVTSLTFSVINNYTGVADVIGGAVILSFAAALGLVIRMVDTARRRGHDDMRSRERELLARELHDTVAHHVSAIAVQAQAGQVIAESQPLAAVGVLQTIEQEASRTLSEMRTIVRVLRDGGEPSLAPQPGIVDIKRLASAHGGLPLVEVTVVGDIEGVGPSLDSAVYRLAQESITNAVRHAVGATKVAVRVDAARDSVRLVVSDDGARRPFDPVSQSGFGLIGMTERAALLGGTLSAGPHSDGGWTVAAVLPREHPDS